MGRLFHRSECRNQQGAATDEDRSSKGPARKRLAQDEGGAYCVKNQTGLDSWSALRITSLQRKVHTQLVESTGPEAAES